MRARLLGLGVTFGLASAAAAQVPSPVPAYPLPAAPAPGVAAPQPPAQPPVPAPAPFPHAVPAAPVSAYPTYGQTLLGCGDGCAPACCDPCGPPGRVWVSAEWLYWVAAGNPMPVLATGSVPGTALPAAGVLGQPGTSTLIGGSRFNGGDFRNGFRLNAGMWLDECNTCGIEGDFFFLGQSGQSPVASSPGTGIISRPFFNALTGLNDAQLVSFPGVVSGGVTVNSTSDVIGGGISGVCNICCDPCGRVDFVGGYRYLNLSDDLSITENLTSLGGTGVAPGTRIIVRDRFQTSNDFHGPVFGLRAEKRYGMVYVMARGSIAMGVSQETVTISGSTTTIPPGGVPTTLPGGLYAQPSNIGSYTSDKFAVIPEIGFRLGVHVTEQSRVFVGYNWLYWSNVARSGDQIDQRVNPNLIPPAVPGGPAVPAVLFRTTDFWLQGVSIGGEVRF
jgi:hypothetical protein